MDHSKVNSETWNKVASIYHEAFKDITLYDATYTIFCNHIKLQNATLFEIACGPGNVTRNLLKLRPDLKIEAIDIAPEMLKIAKSVNPTVDFKLMDCRNIDQISKQYDAVLCGFCMPYLTKEECKKLIQDSAALLKPEAVFYFSTIEGDYDKSKFETSSNGEHKMFVYLHEQKFLKTELEKHNFKLIDVFRIQYQKSDSTTDTHLIFISIKK